MTTGKFIPLFVTVFFSLNHIKLTAQQPYNVLFIAVDDMTERADFFGWPEVNTPNLQRLLNRGMLFNKCYVQYALCNPSRTSLLSGWRPDHTGIFDLTTRPRSVIDSSVTFLPEYFKKYGYRTERYGKIMHHSFEGDITWDFAEPDEKNNSLSLNLKVDIDGEEINAPAANNQLPGGWWVRTNDNSNIQDIQMADDLVQRLQQNETMPFFYGFGLTSPHFDFTPALSKWNMNGDSSVQELLPIDIAGNTQAGFMGNGSSNIVIPNEPANDRSDIPQAAINPGIQQLIKPRYELQRTIHAYEGEASSMDAQLGRVLDEMDRQNLWTNTIVVFFSDHGQHLGEHEGMWRKETLFEEALHIPLIVCVPGKPAGVCNKLVELIDIYPTLLELCGLPPVPGTEASSFVRLLDNPKQDWKSAVFSQVMRTNFNLMGRSVTTKRYRYNSWGDQGEELYDHTNDPKEYTNQANNPQYDSVLTILKKVLAEGWTKSLPPAVDTFIFYRDRDQDGYGSASNFIKSWYQPLGYVPDMTDCDDSNPNITPAATEICDGKDNNCNGQIDEGCLPKLSITGNSTLEGNAATKNIWFTVTLSQPSPLLVKASFVTADSTAVAGSDYVGAVKTVSFSPGEVTKKVLVSIVGDVTAEPDEFFKVLLTNPENATISRNKTSGEIKNDDTKRQINVHQGQNELIASVKSGLNKNIRVWPNPARNTLNLQFQNSFDGTVKIEITDIRGSKIKEWKNSSDHSIQLDMSSFANGEYFLLITDVKGNRFTEKIIILH